MTVTCPTRSPALPGAVDAPLTITERTVQGVVLLDLAGALVAPRGPADVASRVQMLVFEGVRSIAVNLARVDRLDDTGAATLAAAFDMLRGCGGDLKLLLVPPQLIERMTTPPLDRLEHYQGESALIRSYVLPVDGPATADAAPYPCAASA